MNPLAVIGGIVVGILLALLLQVASKLKRERAMDAEWEGNKP